MYVYHLPTTCSCRHLFCWPTAAGTGVTSWWFLCCWPGLTSSLLSSRPWGVVKCGVTGWNYWASLIICHPLILGIAFDIRCGSYEHVPNPCWSVPWVFELCSGRLMISGLLESVLGVELAPFRNHRSSNQCLLGRQDPANLLKSFSLLVIITSQYHRLYNVIYHSC